MSKADDLVAAARAEVGTVEGPKDNETKYGKFTKHDEQPWCGSFIMWCSAQIKYTAMPNLVYTPAGAESFKGKGNFRNPENYTPKPGDIAFFSFTGGPIQHVGIVVRDNGDGTVTTVEGNTVPDGKTGNQANGGEVCLKTRAYKNLNKRKMPVWIVGFGRPKWSN